MLHSRRWLAHTVMKWRGGLKSAEFIIPHCLMESCPELPAWVARVIPSRSSSCLQAAIKLRQFYAWTSKWLKSAEFAMPRNQEYESTLDSSSWTCASWAPAKFCWSKIGETNWGCESSVWMKSTNQGYKWTVWIEDTNWACKSLLRVARERDRASERASES